MQVGRINNNNCSNSTFGMALHMPPKGNIIATVGKRMGEEIEAARPELEKLSKKFDLIVKPERNINHDLEYDRVVLAVTRHPEPTTNDKRGLFTRAFDYVFYKIFKPNPLEDWKYISHVDTHLARFENITTDKIVDTADELVKKFEKAIE